jgi:hypothetical protein
VVLYALVVWDHHRDARRRPRAHHHEVVQSQPVHRQCVVCVSGPAMIACIETMCGYRSTHLALDQRRRVSRKTTVWREMK